MTNLELKEAIEKQEKFLNENKEQTMLRQMVEESLELNKKILHLQTNGSYLGRKCFRV